MRLPEKTARILSDMEKLKIPYPIIVEGKYDKIKLASILEADVFVTDGFRVFAKEEMKALFRKLTEKSKVIVLTDSDGGGRVIRNYFNAVLDKESVIHLYIPEIVGKEKRKAKPSKAGTLGVEGIDADVLRNLFLPFSGSIETAKRGGITKTDLYEWGISGKEGSAEKRAALSSYLGLPSDMTSNALLCAVNVLYSKEEFEAVIASFEEK